MTTSCLRRRPRRAATAALAALAVAVLGACATDDGADVAEHVAEPAAPEPVEPEADDDLAAPDDEDTADAAAPEDDAAATPEPPAEVTPFDDPEELAATLATAELALADEDTPAAHVVRWAEVHQQAYRDLAANPEWVDVARAEVPEELHLAFDRTLDAITEVWSITDPADELPNWRIEAPPPVDELRGYYEEAEATFGVPWEVVAAIHLVETRFGRIHGDSVAGAQGPMQFMPGTWDAYGEGDVHDPRDAILAAGRYLAASGAPDDLEAAIHAYNHSDYYVEAVLAHAEVLASYDHYLDVYHGWRVYYRTVGGDVVLEEGWSR